MAEEKTIKKHRFLDKHTIAGVLLLMFGNFIFIEMIVGTGIAMILQMTLGLETGTGMGIGAIIGSVIALIVWFRFFSPEYRWRPQKGEWGKTFK